LEKCTSLTVIAQCTLSEHEKMIYITVSSVRPDSRRMPKSNLVFVSFSRLCFSKALYSLSELALCSPTGILSFFFIQYSSHTNWIRLPKKFWIKTAVELLQYEFRLDRHKFSEKNWLFCSLGL